MKLFHIPVKMAAKKCTTCQLLLFLGHLVTWQLKYYISWKYKLSWFHNIFYFSVGWKLTEFWHHEIRESFWLKIIFKKLNCSWQCITTLGTWGTCPCTRDITQRTKSVDMYNVQFVLYMYTVLWTVDIWHCPLYTVDNRIHM